MNNNHKIIALIGLLMLEMVQNSVASVVSTGDFNNDFFVMWSPSHVNNSSDGQTSSLKLYQESGTLNTCACWTCNSHSIFKLLIFVYWVLSRFWFFFESDVSVWTNWHANQTSTRWFGWHCRGLLCMLPFSSHMLSSSIVLLLFMNALALCIAADIWST